MSKEAAEDYSEECHNRKEVRLMEYQKPTIVPLVDAASAIQGTKIAGSPDNSNPNDPLTREVME